MALQLQMHRDECAQYKVMIGTPMYGGMAHGIYTRSLVDLGVVFQRWELPFQLHFLFNESLITRARNYIADEFMRSDCTHLMFIDSDIGFNPLDVLTMLALAKPDNDYDVVCGPYPKKRIAWKNIRQAVHTGLADENPDDLGKFVGECMLHPLQAGRQINVDEPVQVSTAGTGFMLIQRKAFEKVKSARPDLLYRPDHLQSKHFDGSREIMAYFMDPIDRWDRESHYKTTLEWLRDALANRGEGTSWDLDSIHERVENALSHEEPESRRQLSEDYFFCQTLWRSGGSVWLCPWMDLQHAGSYIFRGNPVHLAQISPSTRSFESPLACEPTPPPRIAAHGRAKEDASIVVLDVKALEHLSHRNPEGIAVVMPSVDTAKGLEMARLLVRRAGVKSKVFVVEDTLRQGYIRTLNDAAARLEVKYLVYLAEDAFPGVDWLKRAHAALETTGKGLLAFNCGKWHGRVASFGMVRKNWVETLYGGPIFHPAYQSHRADDEITVIARATDQFIYLADAVLTEVDAWKAFRVSEAAAYNFRADDKNLFLARFDSAFDALVPRSTLETLKDEYLNQRKST